MSIKKRKVMPDPTAKAEFEEDGDPKTTGRSAFLQGQHLDCYRFIESNPFCTRDDVARGTAIKSSTCTARIKELIDEGYVFEPPGYKKRNRSGVNSRCLHITSRNQGGKMLDRVRIEVTLAIDHNGDYYAEAHVVGGKRLDPDRTYTHDIKTHRFTMTAPHPDSYKDAFGSGATAVMSRMEIEQNADKIIDAEVIVTDDD